MQGLLLFVFSSSEKCILGLHFVYDLLAVWIEEIIIFSEAF